MNARGTRRPHKTRPYKRSRSTSRGGKKGGCALWLFAAASLPVIAEAVKALLAA